MPEGPEIKRAVDKIAAALEGRVVRHIAFAFDHLAPYAREFHGQTVRAVEARGKAVLTRFPNGWNIYSHNQLYGRWYVRNAGSLPKTGRQLRLAIHTDEKWVLLYSASDIAVLRDEELASHPFLSRLGPDVLDASVTAAQVMQRFRDTQFQRRRLASLLLDQGFLAGLGNYLRSEILFAAGVHHSRCPRDCDDAEIRLLAEAAIYLTGQSYQTGGITNDLQRVADLKAAGWPRRQFRFLVFDRDGQPCFTCGSQILRETAGGRRIYFCPTCQQS